MIVQAAGQREGQLVKELDSLKARLWDTANRNTELERCAFFCPLLSRAPIFLHLPMGGWRMNSQPDHSLPVRGRVARMHGIPATNATQLRVETSASLGNGGTCGCSTASLQVHPQPVHPVTCGPKTTTLVGMTQLLATQITCILVHDAARQG